MATVQELIDNIKDNLGNRNTGNIGSRPIDTVVLANINSGVMDLAKAKKHIPAFEKKISLTITTAGYEYAIPTVDIVGSVIRLKKILRMISVRVGEDTGYTIDRLHPMRRDSLFPLTNTTRTGRPLWYTTYGTSFEFYPYPDTTYTVTGRVIVWPTTLTVNDLSTGIGDEFDDVIEASATASCFKSLQQLEDAAYWDKEHKDLRAQTLAALDDYPDEEQFLHGGDSLIGEMNSIGPTMLAGRTAAYNSALGIQ